MKELESTIKEVAKHLQAKEINSAQENADALSREIVVCAEAKLRMIAWDQQ